jgi:hypothetical protein
VLEDEASEATEAKVNIQDLLDTDKDNVISRDILLLPQTDLWRQLHNNNEGEIIDNGNLKTNTNSEAEDNNDEETDNEEDELYLFENDGYGYESDN